MEPATSSYSAKLLYNFIEITLRRECSPVNLRRIFRTLFIATLLRFGMGVFL